jgi:glucose-6-phosphate-specific signal transduction histidine kinase
MNAKLGWALAVLAVALAYVQYGWQGAVVAVSAVVFWLLMQFTRSLRAMRTAGSAPVGSVASAVMLNAKLKTGQRLMDVIMLTRSLGEKLSDQPETYRWTDSAAVSVTVEFTHGQCVRWTLARPVTETPDAA